MSEIENGGNAFPADASTNLFSRGMSLRDYFAAKALVGMLSCYRDPVSTSRNFRADIDKGSVAVAAYQYADAMLKARQS